MTRTIIVRVKKNEKGNVTDDKVHKNATYQLSGNYLIILEGDSTEKDPFVRTVYNLNDVISWSTRKNKEN